MVEVVNRIEIADLPADGNNHSLASDYPRHEFTFSGEPDGKNTRQLRCAHLRFRSQLQTSHASIRLDDRGPNSVWKLLAFVLVA